uniref:GH18 domain-containing protein n=1 Tax=Globisporangium ultimum (strain ATCC 200006 / CBS 805.95 / DAOM BR144) TaxID=431595 RepID=K3X739_GLOUD
MYNQQQQPQYEHPGPYVHSTGADESYYMHAASDDFERSGSHKIPRATRVKRFYPLIALLVLGAIITAIAVTVHASNDKDGSSTNDSTSSNVVTKAPSTSSSAAGGSSSSSTITQTGGSKSTCPEIAPSGRTVVFWQSEVNGCEKVPVGVTHVVWGFALVADGSVVPTFQNSDAYVKSCVQSLRSKCISSMGSIGGSTNNKNLSAVTDATAFAASAVALVQKFDFDGIDVDDETVGAEFDADRVVAMMKTTSVALRQYDAKMLLTYDAYFFEGEPSFCESPEHASYTRCFPTGVLPHVDWINIMAYNVNQDEAAAAQVYESALNTTFASWATQLGNDFSKATLGICVAKSCAYGPGPSTAVVAQWDAFARQDGHGGMMVYAASGEIDDDFPVTRSILDAA